jgi:energy-coupling factor transport system substrate-specific component
VIWLDAAALAAVIALLAVFAPSVRKTKLRGLLIVALLAAAGAASQHVLFFIPGVQLTTPLVILCGIFFGPGAGLLCGVVSQILTGLLNSIGPWTVWQMLGMGLIGLAAAYLPKDASVLSKAIPPLYAFTAAFLFGWLTNVSAMLWLVGAVSWPAYLTACAASFPFDLSHAVNNAVMLSAAAVPALLKRILPPKSEGAGKPPL